MVGFISIESHYKRNAFSRQEGLKMGFPFTLPSLPEGGEDEGEGCGDVDI
jgi:hypothetical protein